MFREVFSSLGHLYQVTATSYILFLSFLDCSRTSLQNSALSLEFPTSAVLTPLSWRQQEPSKAPEAADLGQQLCCAVSWESSHQCWSLSKADFTLVCRWRCPSLCYLQTSRIKHFIFLSTFSFQTSLSFIQLSWTGHTNHSAYVKLLIEHTGFF